MTTTNSIRGWDHILDCPVRSMSAAQKLIIKAGALAILASDNFTLDLARVRQHRHDCRNALHQAQMIGSEWPHLKTIIERRISYVQDVLGRGSR